MTHSSFGLAFAIALEHSVWGFCCTNPCEQLSGEISTHLVPQLGLGDEILLHTILVLAHLHLVLQEVQDHQFEGSSGGLSSFYICLQIGTSWSHRGRPVIQ